MSAGNDPTVANLRPIMQLAQQGRNADALALCKAALEVHVDQPDLLHAAALCSLHVRDIAGAEQYARRAIASAPMQPHFHNTLANILRESGKLAEAESGYRRAIELAPEYYDPWYNFGVLHRRAGRYPEAERFLLKAVDLRRTAQALNALGLVYQEQERYEDAVQAFREALEIKPDYEGALHNLGVTFNRMTRPEQALECFNQVIARDPGLPQALYNRGNAQQMLGNFPAAIADYQAAIREAPFMAEAHGDLSKLRWMLGETSRYTESFRELAGRAATPMGVEVAYINALLQAGELDAALAAANTAMRVHGDAAPLRHLCSLIHSEAQRHEDALRASAAAVALAPANPDCLIKHARDQIMTGHPDLALDFLFRALGQRPDDQLAWACIGVCWELVGDSRYHALCDYERLVREYELVAPDGYPDMHAFNVDLAVALDRIHNTRVHPPDQTLRHGTQTIGSLFNRDMPIVRKLVASIDRAVAQHIAYLGTLDIPLEGHAHPLLSRLNPQFRYAGSWSVRLSPGGFHINHVHPQGWISSAYYVSLPELPAAESGAGPGCITFGQSELLGPNSRPKRVIRPRPGMLALFPSYFWHGTVPFTTGPYRMTVAFDVVPRTAG